MCFQRLFGLETHCFDSIPLFTSLLARAVHDHSEPINFVSNCLVNDA